MLSYFVLQFDFKFYFCHDVEKESSPKNVFRHDVAGVLRVDFRFSNDEFKN
jgi:hypothetical protein